MMDQNIDRALHIAAVMGCFDVLDLAKRAGVDVASLLPGLAPRCDEMVLAGRYGWVLRGHERVRHLSNLTRSQINRGIEDAQSLNFENDDFGRSLQRVLLGRPPEQNASRTDAMSAIRFASSLPSLEKFRSRLEAAGRRIELETLKERERDTLDFVLHRGVRLVGRTRELTRLTKFATSSDAGAALVVSGDAGVGKSALLTDLLRRTTSGRRVVTVVLDFDDPQLSSVEPAEVFREFTRRLTAAAISTLRLTQSERTALVTTMKVLRESIRSRVTGGHGTSRTSSEEQVRGIQSYAVRAFSSIPTALKEVPILLVLETFEVAMEAGILEIDRLLAMVTSIRTRFGLPNLRAVVAGRSLDTMLAGSNAARVGDLAPAQSWMILSSLTRRSARAMLRNLDQDTRKFLDPELLRKATGIANFYPLSLVLIHQSTREMDSDEIASFLDGAKEGRGLANELNTQFLQSRILRRIKDPAARKLAAPGLLLRMVSPDLIRLVLAEPCHLGKISQEQSLSLFEMVKYSWLTEGGTALFVRHRGDLRRQMISAITASDPEAARQLHIAARNFFLNGPPKDDAAYVFWQSLGTRETFPEGIYHDALSGSAAPRELDVEDARLVKRSLGADIRLLPDEWIAVINASAGDFRTLTASQIESLRGNLREKAITKEVGRLLEVNDAVGAAQLNELRLESNFRAMGGDDAKSPLRGLVGVSREGLHQAVLISWANADVLGAGVAFEQIIRLHDDRGEGLIDGLNDVITRDEIPMGVLAASVTRHPAETSFELPPRLLAERHLAPLLLCSHMLLASDEEYAGYLNNLKASRLLDVVLGQDEFAFASDRRLQGWKLAMRSLIKAPQYGSFEIPKEFLTLEALLYAIPAPNAVSKPFLEAQKLTWRAISNINPNDPRSWQIEDAYQANDSVHFYPQRYGGDASHLMRLLRGLTPELHQPTSQLIRGLSFEDVALWVSEQSRRHKRWPRDLVFEGDAVTATGYFPEQDSLGLVVTCDRLGVLPELLEWMIPRSRKAAALLAAHNRITDRLFPKARMMSGGTAYV